jgi:hypothetical protein
MVLCQVRRVLLLVVRQCQTEMQMLMPGTRLLLALQQLARGIDRRHYGGGIIKQFR